MQIMTWFGMERKIFRSRSKSEGQVLGNWNLVDKIINTKKHYVEKMRRNSEEVEIVSDIDGAPSPPVVCTKRRNVSSKTEEESNVEQSSNSQGQSSKARGKLREAVSRRHTVPVSLRQKGSEQSSEQARPSPRHSWSNDRWSEFRRDGVPFSEEEVFFEETKLENGLLTTTLCSTEL